MTALSDEPLISVVVPVYNVEKYLKRTVEALAAQTYKNMEFILVDDGSIDGSGKICDEAAEADGRFRVIHSENGGVCAARNRGIAAAKGEYIGFCDSDDLPAPDMYETLYGIIRGDGCDVAMIRSAVRFIDGSVLDESDGTKRIFEGKEELLRLLLLGKIQFGVYTKLYSANICRQISFPVPHKINEDKYYFFSAVKVCRKPGYISTAKYYYCRHEGSAVTEKFSEKYFDIVYFADLMEKQIREEFPSLCDCARINTITSYLRVCQLMVLLNGEKEYKAEFDRLRKFLKEQDRALCKKYLDRGVYVKYRLILAGRLPFRLGVKAFSKF